MQNHLLDNSAQVKVRLQPSDPADWQFRLVAAHRTRDPRILGILHVAVFHEAIFAEGMDAVHDFGLEVEVLAEATFQRLFADFVQHGAGGVFKHRSHLGRWFLRKSVVGKNTSKEYIELVINHIDSFQSGLLLPNNIDYRLQLGPIP